MRSGPYFAAVQRRSGGLEGASAGLASVAMYDVARDPSLYSVLHESKVDDGLCSSCRGHRSFSICRSGKTKGVGIRSWRLASACTGASKSARDGACRFIGRLHVDPLALVIPIGGLVDGFHFRKRKFVAFEPERAFPLHVGRENHVASRRPAVGGCLAMQIDQPVRHELQGLRSPARL